MSRLIPVYEDPFRGLAGSVVTSNIIPLYHTAVHSVSWYTTISQSTHTLQYSNSSISNPTNVAWVSIATFGVGAQNGLITGAPQGVRWMRILRTVASAGSVQVDLSIQEG